MASNGRSHGLLWPVVSRLCLFIDRASLTPFAVFLLWPLLVPLTRVSALDLQCRLSVMLLLLPSLLMLIEAINEDNWGRPDWFDWLDCSVLQLAIAPGVQNIVPSLSLSLLLSSRRYSIYLLAIFCHTIYTVIYLSNCFLERHAVRWHKQFAPSKWASGIWCVASWSLTITPDHCK